MITTNVKEFYLSCCNNKAILCIDYGEKNIGFAISDTNLKIAFPVRVLVIDIQKKRMHSITEVINKYNLAGIILGLPLDLDGSDLPVAAQVRSLAKKLYSHYQIPVLLKDERYSTQLAKNFLKDHGVSQKRRELIDDKVAASLILDGVLQEIQILNRENAV